MYSRTIENRMKSLGLKRKDLINGYGLKKGTISKWLLDESSPNGHHLTILCQALRCTPRELESGRFKDQSAPLVDIPVLANRAEMGGGAEMMENDDAVGSISLKDSFLTKMLGVKSFDKLAFINAIGESMSPTVDSGSVVLIDTSVNAFMGDAVYALRVDGLLYIKRVQSDFISGELTVTSDNASVHQSIKLSGTEPVEFLGRAIWVWNGRKL